MIPFPAPFGRAAELQKILDDDAVASDQKVNIRAVIKMYEDGDPPKRIDEWIFVQDGVVCERLPDFSKGTPWWGEVIMTTRKCTLTMYVLYAQGYGVADAGKYGRSSPNLSWSDRTLADGCGSQGF